MWVSRCFQMLSCCHWLERLVVCRRFHWSFQDYSPWHNPLNLRRAACSVQRVVCDDNFACNPRPHAIIQRVRCAVISRMTVTSPRIPGGRRLLRVYICSFSRSVQKGIPDLRATDSLNTAFILGHACLRHGHFQGETKYSRRSLSIS